MRRLRPARASRSKPRTTRVKYDCLDVLTGGEARTVLHELLLSRPDLIPDTKRTADALLAQVSVAENVYVTLQTLDLHDLDAGPRPGGYVEPSESAWAAIEKAVTPYFHDLERRVKLGREDGLYRAEHRGFELLEYAEDSLADLAGHAVTIWRRRRRNALPRTFVETFTPSWDWLARCRHYRVALPGSVHGTTRRDF